jgi:CTP synthase (UTP-ammonia lyase)
VLGIHDAEHEETSPDSPCLFISKLSCSLVGLTQRIYITPGTHAYQAYGKGEVVEQFRCTYGLNSAYRDAIENGELKIVGVTPDGEVRIVELPDHRFFIAMLFVPQLSSKPDMPHPLITTYLTAAIAFQAFQRGSQVRV